MYIIVKIKFHINKQRKIELGIFKTLEIILVVEKIINKIKTKNN